MKGYAWSVQNRLDVLKLATESADFYDDITRIQERANAYVVWIDQGRVTPTLTIEDNIELLGRSVRKSGMTQADPDMVLRVAQAYRDWVLSVSAHKTPKVVTTPVA